MTRSVVLAIDAMSGDHGPGVVIDGCLLSLEQHPDLQMILVGDEAVIRQHLGRHKALSSGRLRVHHASEVVGMDELPSKALRGKKDSSLRVAVDLVHDDQAQACVSAGNTGALMATARFVLKTLPGIDRPAIISPLPAEGGVTHVLDLGANAECTAGQLVQFAVMGSALVNALHNIEKPRVALLNIGEEEIKGNDTIKQAAQILAQSPLNYVGFIEGDGVFMRPVDVVVCDGFVGNVALKAGEGVARLVAHFMREEFMRNWSTRLAGLVARSILQRLAKRMDPRLYNGASLVGLRATVVKSHGSADAMAFANAVSVAVKEVEQSVPERIGRLLEAALATAAPAH